MKETRLEHLSNEELILKYKEFLKEVLTDLGDEIINNLTGEILRRLNEPWRQSKKVNFIRKEARRWFYLGSMEGSRVCGRDKENSKHFEIVWEEELNKNEPWRRPAKTDKKPISQEHYEWLIRQMKLKIDIARRLMEIHGKDEEAIIATNIIEKKLKEIEELYENE